LSYPCGDLPPSGVRARYAEYTTSDRSREARAPPEPKRFPAENRAG